MRTPIQAGLRVSVNIITVAILFKQYVIHLQNVQIYFPENSPPG